MKRVLTSMLPQPHRSVPLSEAEANHAVRVLRLRDGEEVEALDGNGHAAVVLLRTRNGPPRLEFAAPRSASAEKPILSPAQEITPILLEMAVLKGDAMEWVIEKAVELGIRAIQPVLTAHTVVQLKNKGPEAFRIRWQKISDQALKQCGRLERLEILLPKSLEEAILVSSTDATHPRLWCDEAARDTAPYIQRWIQDQMNPSVKSLRLLIGPEGGWSDHERDLIARAPGDNTRAISLGSLVLRAETAALFSMSLAIGAWKARAAQS